MEYIINITLMLAGFILLYLIMKRKIERAVNPKTLVDEIRVEVDKIILSLNSTTEQNINLIEDKITQLTELLDRADKKIVVLRRESEKYSMSKEYSDILRKTKKTDEDTGSVNEKDVKEKVLKLHREGFSPAVIANHTNLPIGEVELIISLDGR